MLLLSLDSTEITATAAVTDGGKLLGQTVIRSGHTHSETLLPAIELLLKAAGLTCDDLDGFACSVGPGSFTGVRIGVATVKGLAFGRGKPCYGVSATEAMAYPFVGVDGIVCAAMDARREQLYNALFRVSGETVTRLTPDRVIAAADLTEELAASFAGEPIYPCGGGYEILRAAAGPGLLRETPRPLRYQTAFGVALAVEAGLAAGTLTAKTDETLSPLYLRPSQAERMKNGG